MKRLLPFAMAAAMLALLSSCGKAALPAETAETAPPQSVSEEETTESPVTELLSGLTEALTEKITVSVPASVRPSEAKRTAAAESTTAAKTTVKATEKETVIITVKPTETTAAPTTAAAEEKKTEKVSESREKDEKGLPAYAPEQDVIELHEKVNLHRAAHGKRLLKLDNVLCRLAYVRAREQTVLFGHKRPDRSSWVGVFAQYGVERGSAGENLFWLENYDYDTQNVVKVTFEGWRDSPGHNENMLDGDWAYTGLARCDSGSNRYYVQIFTDGSYS